MTSRLHSRLKVIELFAGAGFFSSAFVNEGFGLSYAVEIDPVAASTYARNVGSHIVNADVSRIQPWERCDVLVAGPPCQGFSTLGKRALNDPRNDLSLQVVRWASVTKPSIIVIENVAAFLTHPIWSELTQTLEEQGYEVASMILNAYDFGVPQSRRRSFTFASKIGLPEIIPANEPPVRTVREAWLGLPGEPDGYNHHYAPTPSPLALARMRVIPPGGDKRDVMSNAPHLTPRSWWSLRCQVTDSWGRMEWHSPCNTIRTALQNASKGRYIHPEQNRVISLREAARLHSIDDTWQFCGFPTQVARQIGNSIPPRLGRAVARSVRSLF